MLDLQSETRKLGCKPIKTPIEQNHKLCEVVEDTVLDKESYQRLVGRLIYLSHTKSDIAYTIEVVIQFMHNPKKVHLRAHIGFSSSLRELWKRNIIQERIKVDFKSLHRCKLCKIY